MSTKPMAPPPPSAIHAPPPPNVDARSPKSVIPQSVALNVSAGPMIGSDAIVIFGTQKIGKSTLAGWLPGAFSLDVEQSTAKMNVSRDMDIPSWSILRGKIATIAHSPPKGMQSLIVDTATVAQALAVDHVVGTRKAGGGKGEGPSRTVASIEDFGWGRGWQYVAEEFDALIADLDRIRSRGIFVCLVCHAVASPFPNPAGEDFIRWEPHLYAGDKNKRGSIRDRVYRWADHLLFIGYDLFVKDGKGVGSGSRTIYTYELPTHVAGSRVAQVQQSFELSDPGAIWRTLGILPNNGAT